MEKDNIHGWIGFVSVIFILIFLYVLIKELLLFLAVVDETIVTAIIVASGTIIAAVFTVVIGQSINKKREIINAHRDYKIKIYSEFIDFTTNWVFENSKVKSEEKKEDQQKELEKYFIKFAKELTLWAPPSVIKAWSNFRDKAGIETSADPLKLVDQIYRTMRKDLGNSNFGLDKKTLIRLFVKGDSD